MIVTDYSIGILQYIPFFYVIWSDDLLSASEISVVQKVIELDTSLNVDEKHQLRRWLKRDTPPFDDEIKNWKQTIANSKVRLIESDTYPLSSLSQRLVNSENLNDHLKHIEVHLGIQPNHYNHLFDVEVVHEKTSSEYDANILDEILKGEHARVVDRFRSFLDKPDFSWQVLRNKEDFRNRILQQVQLLGEAGYGAMAYPPEYGGTGDMPAYAAIFEHLMFVDGSLAVKFGVQFGLFGGSIQKLGTKNITTNI